MKHFSSINIFFLGTVLLLGTVLISGCSSKDKSVLKTVSKSVTINGETVTFPGELSVTLKNDFCAKKVVSLTPAGSEILCKVDAFDAIAARTDFCNYPEILSSKPSTGGFSGDTVSIETILSFNPDFIYANKAAHSQLVEPLKKAGIPVYLSEAITIEQICQEIQFIGLITGHYQKGTEVKNSIQTFFEEMTNLTASEEKSTVYYEVWNQPLLSIGNMSFINQMISFAGGINIFADISEEFPFVSEETIIARNPQIIIVPEENGYSAEEIKNRSGWQNIDAVKNNKIFVINSDCFSRPGPRVTDGTLIMYFIINPDQL